MSIFIPIPTMLEMNTTIQQYYYDFFAFVSLEIMQNLYV